jgi:hypothetical protein
MRLFVAARTSLSLPDSGFICGSCRMSYLKWRGKTEFVKVLDQIDTESNEVMNDADKQVSLSVVDLRIILLSFV